MTRKVNTGKNANNSNAVIHTDADCMHVTPDSMDVADAPVNADELAECSWCADTATRNQDQYHDCPFCGETVPKLPNHLPCEEQP